jgi:integrase
MERPVHPCPPEVSAVQSASFPMRDFPTSLISLADVVRLLQDHPDLPDARRRDLISAVRRIAALLDVTCEQLPASLGELRPRLNRILPAAHGLKPKTWQNLRSNLAAAIKTAVPSGSRRRPHASAAWRRLRNLLPDKRMQNGLSRFLTWCERDGLQPDQITDAVADRFAHELIAGTLVAEPQDLHRRACRLWNEAAAIPGWPPIALAVPDYRKPRTTLPAHALPGSFQADLDRHLAWLSGRDLFADRPPPTVCKPRTVELRRRLMLLAASALAASGHTPERLESLADLVAVDAFKTILRHYLGKAGEPVSVFARGLATALIAVAEHWTHVTPEHLAALKGLRRRLGKMPSGLTSKNRITLRELSDPAIRHRLLALPRQLIGEAESGRLNAARAALRFQLALAIELLLHAPIRMNNLTGLRLDQNLVRPGGRHALWHLVLSGAEVKNGEPQEYELPPDVTRLLDRYLKRFRAALEPGDSQALFVAQGGKPKSQTTLSQQLTAVIRDRVGVRMTPHQFRHFAAKLLLEHSPGAFAAAGQLLGHRNPKTTINFYAGIDTLTAGRHFDTILAAERARTVGAKRPRTRRSAAGRESRP